jgi:hypothetical protein
MPTISICLLDEQAAHDLPDVKNHVPYILSWFAQRFIASRRPNQTAGKLLIVCRPTVIMPQPLSGCGTERNLTSLGRLWLET